MDQDVINKVMKAESREQTMRVLSERRIELLTAIENGTVDLTKEIMGELFDLNIALGDADMFKDDDR